MLFNFKGGQTVFINLSSFILDKSFVGVFPLKEIHRERKPEIMYMTFIHWYKVVFPWWYTSRDEHIWILLICINLMHLAFLVLLEIPCEDEVLERSGLSVKELHAVWEVRRLYLMNEAVVQLKVYSGELFQPTFLSRYIFEVEAEIILIYKKLYLFFLYYLRVNLKRPRKKFEVDIRKRLFLGG